MLTRSTLIFLLLSFLSPLKSQDAGQMALMTDTPIFFEVLGDGSPTVIFENGMGNDFSTWGSIPDSIAIWTRVIRYDRAGIGKSYPSKSPRTVPNMVKELRHVLKIQRIKPPYIYVAHSMGSYLARYWAVRWPDEIVGIILVDPSPDKLYDDYSKEEYEEFKKHGDESFKTASKGEQKEWKKYLDNRKYVADKPISDDIPMIILSATEWDFYNYHEAIMNKNPSSQHLNIEGGHNLQKEQPELIIELTEQLIKNYYKNSK